MELSTLAELQERIKEQLSADAALAEARSAYVGSNGDSKLYNVFQSALQKSISASTKRNGSQNKLIASIEADVKKALGV